MSPRTPDRTPGPTEEEELQLDDRGPGGDSSGDPTVEGALRRITNTLRFFVGSTIRQVLQIKNAPTGFADADFTGIADGNVLEYQASTKQIIPGTGSGGGGLTAGTHRPLDQLVHDIAEDSFTEVVYTGNRVDAVEVYTSAAKTTLIRKEVYTYTGQKVTKVVTTQYDAAGVLIVGETYTEDIVYSGAQVDDITGTLT